MNNIFITPNNYGLNDEVRAYGYKLTLNKTGYAGTVHTNVEDRYDEIVEVFGNAHIYHKDEL